MMRAMSMRMAADAIDAANAEMLSILNGYDQSAAPPVCPPRTTASAGNCESRPGGEAMNQCQPGFRLVGNRCVAPGAKPASARLLAANALMLLKHGDLVSADYVTALKTKYAAEVFKNASLDDINGWVAKKTEGKIGECHHSIPIRRDPSQRCLLKAHWASCSIRSSPRRPSISQVAEGRCPLMNQTAAPVSRGGYRAVRLNYGAGACPSRAGRHRRCRRVARRGGERTWGAVCGIA
jgi:hypothetical protein